MLWILISMLAMLAGMVVMVLGQVLIGLILLLAGGCLMAFIYSTMMRGRGQDPDQGSISGVPGGMGKQQSDAISIDPFTSGEQNAAIWDKMEDKK